MEVPPLCITCVCQNVCRHTNTSDENGYFRKLENGIEIGVIKCPFHIQSLIRPVVQGIAADRPFRPNLNEQKTEPTKSAAKPKKKKSEKLTKTVPVVKWTMEPDPAPCMVCGAETKERCSTCGQPLCENCETEDLATGKRVCPICWDAEPAAVIKNSGEVLHV